jgi:cyclase
LRAPENTTKAARNLQAAFAFSNFSRTLFSECFLFVKYSTMHYFLFFAFQVLSGAKIMNNFVSIMPCLDMRDGRVVKGVHFVDIADAGDPVQCAQAYCQAGADELAMLDITATVESRSTMLELVRQVAEVCSIPFTVGGGIADVSSAKQVLEAGADKVSVSSAAFRKPQLIPALLKEFGADAVTIAIDLDVNAAMPSGYEVYIDGGRTATGVDALEWAKKVDDFGVRVILPTSKAGDGARTGYDLPVISALAKNCKSKIVASGGAGKLEHFLEAAQAGAQILLAASVFHFHTIDISELKQYLRQHGVAVRL